jgi:regulator of nonsense transcripts 1
VNAEQAEAESIVNERLSTWSIKRLQAEGYCLMGVTAYWPKYKHYGRFVAVFSVGPGVSLPDLRFE